ncbi:MAG: M28 family peptidase [Candidatus Heimdallarchaeota archaeon]|nr:M28 family peptidase [Candidatus Heimdallarchaeota archaeon]MCK4954258.1 M28 family peptidase [Candidatus Heimdallarchaeota archaeon]
MDSLIEPIKYIADNFGPRIAGTEADHKNIRYIEERFKTYTSNVTTESFPVVGRSLQHLINFIVWGYFISVLCYLILPPLALGLALFMLLIYYLARFKDNNLLNLLVKKDLSKNVVAKFEPTKVKKKLVIFSGHHDSAFHMPLFEKMQTKIALIQNGAILGLVMLVISGIWKTIFFITPVVGIKEIFSYSIRSVSVYWFLLPDLIFILAILGLVFAFYFLFNMVTKTPLIGANDNLSSVSILFALGEYLRDNPPENIEVRLISFGGEEPGLIGSKFYVDNHIDELKDAINLNYETVGIGSLGIIAKEKDNNISHCEKLIHFIQEVAEENGFDLPAKEISYGNSDAGSFSKRKISATTIYGFGQGDVFTLWHSLEDVVANLDEKTLEDTRKISIKLIEKLNADNS